MGSDQWPQVIVAVVVPVLVTILTAVAIIGYRMGLLRQTVDQLSVDMQELKAELRSMRRERGSVHDEQSGG